MKIINTKELAFGRRRLTVEVDDNEDLISLKADGFYKLCEPHDEILPGHVVVGMRAVYWDSLSQKWID